METFSALLAICARNSPGPQVNSRHKGQRCGTFDVFFDLRRNKRLSNQYEAGDLRRHRTHYDVTVLIPYIHKDAKSLGGY